MMKMTLINSRMSEVRVMTNPGSVLRQAGQSDQLRLVACDMRLEPDLEPIVIQSQLAEPFAVLAR